MKKNLTIALILIFSVTVLFSVVTAKDNTNAWLGISTQTVDDELAEAFNLDVSYGAIINEIYEDSPADKAQLLEGDVIILFNSEKVYDFDDLIDYLEDSAPNDIISLTIMRANDKMTFDVTLGEMSKRKSRRIWNNKNNISMPSTPSMPSMPNMPDFNFNSNNGGSHNYHYSFGNSSYIGVSLSSLSDQLRDYFGTDEDEGILVSEVEDDSPADKAGIKAGDIIIKADDDAVADYNDLKDVISDKDEGEIIALTIIRDKRKKQIDVTVAERENRDSYTFNAPDISFNFPKGQYKNTFFSDGLHELFNSDEFQDEIKELKIELENLKFEINNEMYDQLNSKEFQREMRKLKKELKSEKALMNKELKEEMSKLKKELKMLEKRIDD